MNSPTPASRSGWSLRPVEAMSHAILRREGWSVFRSAFFSGVMRGDNVEQSWLAASNAMAMVSAVYQNACAWDNGNGHLAVDLYLGASFVAGKDIPQIGSVCGNQIARQNEWRHVVGGRCGQRVSDRAGVVFDRAAGI